MVIYSLCTARRVLFSVKTIRLSGCFRVCVFQKVFSSLEKWKKNFQDKCFASISFLRSNFYVRFLLIKQLYRFKWMLLFNSIMNETEISMSSHSNGVVSVFGGAFYCTRLTNALKMLNNDNNHAEKEEKEKWIIFYSVTSRLFCRMRLIVPIANKMNAIRRRRSHLKMIYNRNYTSVSVHKMWTKSVYQKHLFK